MLWGETLPQSEAERGFGTEVDYDQISKTYALVIRDRAGNGFSLAGFPDLRVLMHTRFAPTPAIRSFEQDIFETVRQTLISRYELLNYR